MTLLLLLLLFTLTSSYILPAPSSPPIKLPPTLAPTDPNSDIITLLSPYPHPLNLPPLESLNLHKNPQILRLLTLHHNIPTVKGYTRTITKNSLNSRLENLEYHFGEQTELVIRRAPKLLNYKPEKINETVIQLQSLFLSELDLELPLYSIIKQPKIMYYKTETIREKILCLKLILIDFSPFDSIKRCWIRKYLFESLCGQPQVLFCSYSKLIKIYDSLNSDFDLKRTERRHRLAYTKLNPEGTIQEYLEEEVKNRKRIEGEGGVKEFYGRRYGVQVNFGKALEKGKGREGLREMIEVYFEGRGEVP